jgi:hypothetical protein
MPRIPKPKQNKRYFSSSHVTAAIAALFVIQQISSASEATKRIMYMADAYDQTFKKEYFPDAQSMMKQIKGFSRALEYTVDTNGDEKSERFAKYNQVYSYNPPSNTQPWQPAPECGAGPEFGGFFKLSPVKRSRYEEDQKVYNYFFKHRLKVPGTYVELGAFDGQKESNSRFFDLCLGWKGLLIEGNPESFQKVLRNRPQTHRMSFAPSCSAEYEAVNKTVQFAEYPMANSGLKGRAKTYDLKPMVDVPCGPLGPVLGDIFEGEHINFFSLDVEGAEPLVLETIDFDKIRIDVLMVEVQNNFCGAKSECKTRDETRAIMKKHGYKRYEGLVRASDIYVHPRSQFLLPPGAYGSTTV